jgi:hypothetical protein
MDFGVVKKILGINEAIPLNLEELSSSLKVTFYPYISSGVSEEVAEFSNDLKSALKKAGAEIIPYEDALVPFPAGKFLKWYFFAFISLITVSVAGFFAKEGEKTINGSNFNFSILKNIKKEKKIKKGIVVIATGKGKEGNMPIDHIMGFRDNCIVTILDMPAGIDGETNFQRHFDVSMNLFAQNMTNVVICANKKNWIIYNFAGASSLFLRNTDFDGLVFKKFIPKVAAPIRAPFLSEFKMQIMDIDFGQKKYDLAINDLAEGGRGLERFGLFPSGKLVDDLPFSNTFYRWVGARQLDNRIGMSYGFLARQMPVEFQPLIPFEKAKLEFKDFFSGQSNYFTANGDNFIVIVLGKDKFCLRVPDVWVLSQRSGSNKLRFDRQKDLIKIGLVRGKMILEIPGNSDKKSNYFRPSFDTRVIVAHACGNAVIGSVLSHLIPESQFVKKLREEGMAMIHWHGYLAKNSIPARWNVHGYANPNVPCATLQSAIYAFNGKINSFIDNFQNSREYSGDIHIEPYHGSIVNCYSVKEFVSFLNKNQASISLGDKNLSNYFGNG